MVGISQILFDQLIINLITMKLSSSGKLIVTINDEYFYVQYFIFEAINEYILEEYWRICARKINHKINLFIHLVHWYEMDTY
jgi:hypothetical protein